MGAVLVLRGYSKTFFGMAQRTIGLGKGEDFWYLFFFFFLMNILGRRRRGSQGDLVFQDLRSSVKQNKLSSFKVNDGKWDASVVWAKKPGLGRVASQAGLVGV